MCKFNLCLDMVIIAVSNITIDRSTPQLGAVHLFVSGLAPGIEATLTFRLWIWSFAFIFDERPEHTLFMSNSHSQKGLSIGLMLGFGRHPYRPYLVTWSHGSEVVGAFVPFDLDERRSYEIHVAVKFDVAQVFIDRVLRLELAVAPDLHQRATFDGPRCPLQRDGPLHYRTGVTMFGSAKQFEAVPAIVDTILMVEGWVPSVGEDGFQSTEPTDPGNPSQSNAMPLPGILTRVADVLQAQTTARHLNDSLFGGRGNFSMFDLGVWLTSVGSTERLFPHAMPTVEHLLEVSVAMQEEKRLMKVESNRKLVSMKPTEVIAAAIKRDGVPPRVSNTTPSGSGQTGDNRGTAVRCLDFHQGYWSFQWCHEMFVIQYHTSRNGERTTTASSMSLGTHVREYVHGQGDSISAPERVVDSDGDDTADADSKILHAEYFVNGSFCEKAEQNRTALVSFQCCVSRENTPPAAMQGKFTSMRIQHVHEPSTCNYDIRICVPDLCDWISANQPLDTHPLAGRDEATLTNESNSTSNPHSGELDTSLAVSAFTAKLNPEDSFTARVSTFLEQFESPNAKLRMHRALERTDNNAAQHFTGASRSDFSYSAHLLSVLASNALSLPTNASPVVGFPKPPYKTAVEAWVRASRRLNSTVVDEEAALFTTPSDVSKEASLIALAHALARLDHLSRRSGHLQPLQPDMAMLNVTLANRSHADNFRLRLLLGDRVGRLWTEGLFTHASHVGNGSINNSTPSPRDATFNVTSEQHLRAIYRSEQSETVDCGAHKARSCSACPSGHGRYWCNGDCVWVVSDSDSGTCVRRNGLLPEHSIDYSMFLSMPTAEGISVGYCPVVAAFLRSATRGLLQNRESFMPHHANIVNLFEEPELSSLGGEDAESSQYQLQLAESGDAHAQSWVAARYYWGALRCSHTRMRCLARYLAFCVFNMHLGDQGFQQDRALAFDYYQRAAAQGIGEAHYNLGVLETEGFPGHDVDREAAYEHFEAAHETGFGGASNGLGGRAMEPGPSRNLTKAFEYFQSASETGSLDGYFNLANLLRRGGYNLTVFRDEHAVRSFAGVDSTDEVSCMPAVNYSRLAEPNLPMAMYYYAAAAEQGHFQSMQLLGLEYSRHDGWLGKYYSDQRDRQYRSDLLDAGMRIAQKGSDNEIAVIVNLIRPDEDEMPLEERVGVGISVVARGGFVLVEDVDVHGQAFAKGVRAGSVVTHVNGIPIATVQGYSHLAHGRKNFSIWLTAPSFNAESCIDDAPTAPRYQNNPLFPSSHHAITWPTAIGVQRGGGDPVVLPLRPSCEIAAYYLSQAARQGHSGELLESALSQLVESGISSSYSLVPCLGTECSGGIAETERHSLQRAHEMFEAAASAGYANAYMNSGWLFARSHMQRQLSLSIQGFADAVIDDSTETSLSEDDTVVSTAFPRSILFNTSVFSFGQSTPEAFQHLKLAGLMLSSQLQTVGATSNAEAQDGLSRWLRAAEMGNTHAMVWLGYSFDSGDLSVPGIRVSPWVFALLKLVECHDIITRAVVESSWFRERPTLFQFSSPAQAHDKPLGEWWLGVEDALRNIFQLDECWLLPLRIVVGASASLLSLCFAVVKEGFDRIMETGSTQHAVQEDDGVVSAPSSSGIVPVNASIASWLFFNAAIRGNDEATVNLALRLQSAANHTESQIGQVILQQASDLGLPVAILTTTVEHISNTTAMITLKDVWSDILSSSENIFIALISVALAVVGTMAMW